MASELELRWLKTKDYKGAAKRFAVYCKEDIQTQADTDSFDLTVYQDAIKLVLSKLDRSLTLVELTKKIEAEEERSQAPGLEDESLEQQDDENNTDNIDDSTHNSHNTHKNNEVEEGETYAD